MHIQQSSAAGINDRRRIVVRALFISTILVSSSFAAAPRFSCDETRRSQLIGNAVLIDVRAPNDFLKGHIQGALNFLTLAGGANGLPHDKELVVYCSENNCPLSETAASQLARLGYKNVHVLDGGFDEWLRLHYPADVGAGKMARDTDVMMTSDEALKRINAGQLLVVDVRPRLEFSAGHLPRALSIPLEILALNLGSLAKQRDVLIYDRRSDRSHQAAHQLMEAGYKSFELSGGLAGWIKKGHGLEVK